MKIIRPAHGKPSFIVPDWKFMADEAKRLRLFIKTAKFEGNYNKAFALAHAEVSVAPLNFFVVNEDPFEIPDREKKGSTKKMYLAKEFGSWCIVNPRIIQFSGPVYWKEACNSFPYREPKNVDRMNKITLTYQIPFFGFLLKKKKKLEGLPAFIAQHEIEHASGQNIYFKKTEVAISGKEVSKKEYSDCQFCAVIEGSPNPVDIKDKKEFVRLFKIHEENHGRS